MPGLAHQFDQAGALVPAQAPFDQRGKLLLEVGSRCAAEFPVAGAQGVGMALPAAVWR